MHNLKRVIQPKNSLLGDFLGRLMKTTAAKIGVVLLVLMVIVCFVGPLLSPYGKNDIDLTKMYSGPSAEHWFGCDAMGRDILTRLLNGGQYSLILGLITATISSIVSILIGCIAGYFGGATETFIMRFMDVWSALPAMLLAIMVSAVLGAGFFATVFALTVGGIAGGVRMTRGQILAERKKEYIEAAESINCSKLSIMFKHLLPNVVQPMIIIATMNIGATIMMAAGLSYIGLGIQPPTPEWGAMLADGRAYIRLYPHMITFPGIAIALTVLSVNLIGDGLRDALDPKLRD
jgi:ABC-type dipeptide/oligopeptide/nickel transport system permease subunit